MFAILPTRMAGCLDLLPVTLGEHLWRRVRARLIIVGVLRWGFFLGGEVVTVVVVVDIRRGIAGVVRDRGTVRSALLMSGLE